MFPKEPQIEVWVVFLYYGQLLILAAIAISFFSFSLIRKGIRKLSTTDGADTPMRSSPPKRQTLYKILKIIALWISIFAFLKTAYFLLGFLALIAYSQSMGEYNELERIELCELEKKTSYVGHIDKIERYEYNNYMHERVFNLEITTSDSAGERVEYRFDLPDQADLLHQIFIGQKVYKNSGDIDFEIETKDGQRMRFLVPPCNESER